ncbi:MAG: MerR family transcriptional regulator [Desertimonas sp.]
MSVDTDTDTGPAVPIAEVVERTGCTHDTLRYYEKEGLIRPDRDAGGRRRYTDQHVARVIFLQRMRSSAMPIAVLKEYVALLEQGQRTEPERLAIMQRHRQAVVAQRARLDEALAIIELKIDVYGGACGA